MTADVTALEALAAELARAAANLDRQAQQVVSRGARNIKKDWRANAAISAGAHGRLYPMSITYDDPVVVPGVGVSTAIGPDKDLPQGALGNLLEFGSVHNEPHNDGGRALQAEAPRFIAAAEALGGGLL